MKQVLVKPHSAHLTRDTELIGKMVLRKLSRILTVSVSLEQRDNTPNTKTEPAKILNGKKSLPSSTLLALMY